MIINISIINNPVTNNNINTIETDQKCLTNKEYKSCIIKHRGTKKIKKQLGNKNMICSICLDNLEDNRIWHQLNCGHFYHPKCLKLFLTKKCIEPRCPVCRESAI